MRLVIRPSTEADGPAIAALLSGPHPRVEPAQMAWKYWRVSDQPGEPRSFVVHDGSAIVAHAGLVPGVCVTTTHSSRFVHVIDWAARTAAAGTGLSLMRSIARRTDGLFAVGGSTDTLRLLPVLGFKQRGSVTGFVRTLRPRRILADSRPVSWRLLPRLARSFAWTLSAPRDVSPGWSARRVTAEAISDLLQTLPVPRAGLAVMERTRQSLAHALRCPIARMELYALKNNGVPRGYFLLSFLPGQALLADCWVTVPQPEEWRTMLQLAARTARRDPSVAELAAWSSDSVLRNALLASGFHPTHELPLLLKTSDRFDLGTAELRVQPLDNDTAFMHSGRVELLA